MTLRRKTLLVLAVTAAVTALLTSATDLLAEHRAEERIVARATRGLRPDGPVHADLTTPFAGLRTLGGEVGDVEVSAEGVHRQHASMDVTVRLDDVTTDGDSAGGTATAVVGYDQVTRRLGTSGNGLRAGGRAGDLILTGSAGRLGLPVTVRATLSTTPHALTITPTTVSILGRSVAVTDLAGLPGASALREELTPRTVPVGALPHGVALTSAQAADDGLVLGFSIPAGPTPNTAGKTV
ncbi:LmeA family phospholipid-binding protein [Streptomyces sp. NRRL S-1022]|uniref:LmeA family phospholipid-binding protein n=1 Tax=Streptomyces sp. NRRL S-1022 TaxID=1463880 RepID=UPI0004BF0A58|nr:LmeA family phospholipid-binding protein [Streptomyces sp. NRRL S-1022]